MRHADYDMYYDYIEVEPEDQEQLRELEKREIEYEGRYKNYKAD